MTINTSLQPHQRYNRAPANGPDGRTRYSYQYGENRVGVSAAWYRVPWPVSVFCTLRLRSAKTLIFAERIQALLNGLY
jgi:hypothetical protein